MDLIYVLLLLVVLPTIVFAQTVSDPCANFYDMEGSLGGDYIFPELCWRIQPNIGLAYVPTTIYLQFTGNFTLYTDQLTIYEGISPDSHNTIAGDYTGNDNPLTEFKAVPYGKLFVYLTGDEGDISFTLTWKTGTGKQLKTSLVVLSSVIIMYAIPTVLVCGSLCIRSKKTRQMQKENPAYGRKTQTILFWTAVGIGLILMVLILGQKITLSDAPSV